MDTIAKVLRLEIPNEKRMIAISDIHGNLDLLVRLLGKIQFSSDDVLLLLGDLYTKGPQGEETLRYLIDLCKEENVHALRGNCDWLSDSLEDTEKEWLDSLPHIIETDGYIFVHGGLTSGDLREQDAFACMKNDAFMEQGLVFDKYIVTGHWPTFNYCHQIPSHNPIINHEQRIIAIDGGTIKKDGQLNAFIIQNDTFTSTYVDALPIICAEKDQTESGGTINITWLDRFVEPIEIGEEFGIYRHVESGKTLCIPLSAVWKNEDGRFSASSISTDYYLPVAKGDSLSVVASFSDRFFAKKDGVMGWVRL